MVQFTLHGFMLILFGRRYSLSLGFGRWLVPMINLVVADHFLLWNGFLPFQIAYSEMPRDPDAAFGVGLVRSDIMISQE